MALVTVLPGQLAGDGLAGKGWPAMARDGPGCGESNQIRENARSRGTQTGR